MSLHNFESVVNGSGSELAVEALENSILPSDCKDSSNIFNKIIQDVSNSVDLVGNSTLEVIINEDKIQEIYRNCHGNQLNLNNID